MVVLVAAAALFLLLLILAIVFAVKLVHRNQELDDLYDEYDIPFEEEREKLSASPLKKEKAKDDTMMTLMMNRMKCLRPLMPM